MNKSHRTTLLSIFSLPVTATLEWRRIEALFVELVDDYLATCEKLGRAPQKPYSGKLMLRVPPEIHARAAMMAQAHGLSINQWAADVLAHAS